MNKCDYCGKWAHDGCFIITGNEPYDTEKFICSKCTEMPYEKVERWE